MHRWKHDEVGFYAKKKTNILIRMYVQKNVPHEYMQYDEIHQKKKRILNEK